MLFRIEGRSEQYDADRLNLRGEGGEAFIYDLTSGELAKLYHEQVLDRSRQEKVLSLCGRFDHFAGLLEPSTFAFPDAPAMSLVDDEVVGFQMDNLGDHPSWEQCGYDLDAGAFRSPRPGKSLDDQRASELVFALYKSLEALHTARIVIGDLNPKNVIVDVDAAAAKFVDIDSCHIEDFGCKVFTEDYLDPIVEVAGKGLDGSLKYTADSDYYAAAIMSYELLVGATPFFLRTASPMRVTEMKERGISLLGLLADGEHLSGMGVEVRHNDLHDQVLSRLSDLQQLDGGLLCNYWHQVLVRGRRHSLLGQLPISDSRHPAYRLLSNAGAKTIVDALRANAQLVEAASGGHFFTDADRQTIWGLTRRAARLKAVVGGADPAGFQLFVENLGFDYQALLQNGTG